MAKGHVRVSLYSPQKIIPLQGQPAKGLTVRPAVSLSLNHHHLPLMACKVWRIKGARGTSPHQDLPHSHSDPFKPHPPYSCPKSIWENPPLAFPADVQKPLSPSSWGERDSREALLNSIFPKLPPPLPGCKTAFSFSAWKRQGWPHWSLQRILGNVVPWKELVPGGRRGTFHSPALPSKASSHSGFMAKCFSVLTLPFGVV